MLKNRALIAALLLSIASVAAAVAVAADHPAEAFPTMFEHPLCRTVDVGGVKVFYREAGRSSLPTLVLLHGNPSSSFMFRDLIPRLANRFHLIAPDYPGFGYSDTPPPESYRYTFDHLTQTIDQFLTKI